MWSRRTPDRSRPSIHELERDVLRQTMKTSLRAPPTETCDHGGSKGTAILVLGVENTRQLEARKLVSI